MANTYTSLFYHLIFSTKNRVEYISQDIEERVWNYIGGIARAHKIVSLKIGGVEDHIHAVLQIPKTLSPSQTARLLKSGSSKWIHEEFPNMREFAWQDGYGAFTISKSNLPIVIRYVEHQRQHHIRRTFQEEYLDFLLKHEIEYDERYLWG